MYFVQLDLQTTAGEETNDDLISDISHRSAATHQKYDAQSTACVVGF